MKFSKILKPWAWFRARQPQIPVSSPVQPDLGSGTSPTLSPLAIERFCALYARAVLIRMCRNPRKFGFDPDTATIYDYGAKTISFALQLGQAIEKNNRRIDGIVNPAAPVWITVGRLTEIDALTRIPVEDEKVVAETAKVDDGKTEA